MTSLGVQAGNGHKREFSHIQAVPELGNGCVYQKMARNVIFQIMARFTLG